MAGAASAASGGASSPADVPAALRARYAAGSQEHVFRFVDAGKVSRAEAAALVAQLEGVDVSLVNELFTATMAHAGAAGGEPAAAARIGPCPRVQKLGGASGAEAEAWRASGLAAIAAGSVAVIVLAGGQGTRLGFDRPKGEYCLGLPSGRSLFALQMQRVARLRALAAAHAGAAHTGAPLPRLPVYVMTSPQTHAQTEAYLHTHGAFGLPPSDVKLFCQGTLPCLSTTGKMLLESGAVLATAPDGNGGIYRALHLSGCVEDMKQRGIKSVHVYAVDNAIVRVGDPAFIGFCLARGADVGSKVCAKTGPHEKVGVLCTLDGRPAVVEYSELDKARAEAVDPVTGELVLNAGNLCLHYFSLPFLEGPCSPAHLPKVYHVARKAIPVADETTGGKLGKAEQAALGVNGIKLESFIFDVFPSSTAMAPLEIDRAAEFAPVKNAPGAAEDSPDTARAMLSALHAGWLAAAGALVVTDGGAVEVSPLASYAGEGLGAMAAVEVRAPALVVASGEDVAGADEASAVVCGSGGATRAVRASDGATVFWVPQ